jgi:hypothetical protein
MVQRKDSPNRISDGGDKVSPKVSSGGNDKSAGKGGGKSASGGTADDPAGNTTLHREKASPSGRQRGETSHADRA